MCIVTLLVFYIILPDPDDAAAPDAKVAIIAAGGIAVGANVFWIGYRKRRPS